MEEGRGIRLRTLRLAQKKGATELAREVGVSANYIHKLEAGDNVGSPAVLARIAEALSTTVDDLLGADVDGHGVPLPAPELREVVTRVNALSPPVRALIAQLVALALDLVQPLTENERAWLQLFSAQPDQEQDRLLGVLRGMTESATNGDIRGPEDRPAVGD